MPDAVTTAQAELDAHVHEIVAWHLSPETGTPFWQNWAATHNIAHDDIKTVADLERFPRFDDEWLRRLPHHEWIPRAFADRPFKVFETGGTTGMPKQRLSWEDHLVDYTAFSETLDQEAFPRGANWLMIGPTGPRRLRLSIEHLANIRGGVCYFVDLDPRWVKKLLANGDVAAANQYKTHVVDQALTILRHRDIQCLFTTPKILEAMGEQLSLVKAGIRGVFCGGTQMTPQILRFLCEEVLDNEIQLVPTYGNTLMGLACSIPIGPEAGYSVTYYPPQPRALLRVVNPEQPDELVPYEEFGRVELTTLTKEFFMPRFLERDQALRCRPCERFPWDGVGEVQPFVSQGQIAVEGVY